MTKCAPNVRRLRRAFRGFDEGGPLESPPQAPENGSTSSFFSIRSGPGGLLSRGPRHPSEVISATVELVPFQDLDSFDSRQFEVAVLQKICESESSVLNSISEVRIQGF